jgi:hypothetical protein
VSKITQDERYVQLLDNARMRRKVRWAPLTMIEFNINLVWLGTFKDILQYGWPQMLGVITYFYLCWRLRYVLLVSTEQTLMILGGAFFCLYLIILPFAWGWKNRMGGFLLYFIKFFSGVQIAVLVSIVILTIAYIIWQYQFIA